MWIPVKVRHDTGFLRVGERPLIEHLVDALNEIEEKGEIVNLAVIQHVEDKLAELVVNVKENYDTRS